MLKILIVEDQTLIRKGIIKMIDWDKLGVLLMGEAENGDIALETIKKIEPDIVISDMRMPGGDGVALLKNISENYPKIKTIVISGYDDFEYARQAIKSGSINYILKPVNPDELNESIKKACELIIKERAFSSFDKDKLINECLFNLVHGISQDRESITECLEGVDLNIGSLCAVVVKKNESGFEPTSICEQLNASKKFQRVFLIQDSNEYVLAFWSKHDQNTVIFEETIYKCLKSIILEKVAKDIKVIISIGKVYTSVDQLKDSYNTACEIRHYSLFEDMSQILRYGELVDRKSYNIPISEYESELVLNITSGNANQVENILDHLTQSVFERKGITIDSVKLLISNLCHILLKTDTGLTEEIQVFLKKLNSQDYFLSFDSMKNIKQTLYNLYLLTTRKYLNEKGGKVVLVLNIKEFISKNYANEIGLDEISKLFHVNASYLSSMFKKETGENLNEYITKVRINNAIRIIETCEVKASDLAQMVGYSDFIYFHKVFKKVTGKTPKEYQKQKK